MKNSLQVFSGNANPDLAKKICSYLNMSLGDVENKKFPDGEINMKVLEDVRGADVYIVQPTSPPVNENLMELMLFVDCMKRASAERITAVVPYFGYARQDRKAEGRVPISAKLVANMLTIAGVNRVVAMDMHSAQIQGFFDIPMDHLFAAPVMIDYFKKLELSKIVVVSPDVGGIKMARAYAKRLSADLAIFDKRRSDATSTEVMHVIGDIEGKNIILVDDIISTGGTILEAANAARANGARDLYLCATHPIFSTGAIDKIKSAGFKEVIVSDTIPLADKKLPNVRVLSVSKLLGEAIRRIHYSESVSSLFV